MNEEKDFFKTCFNTVAGLEVKNESQAIAKEIVLSEIENLQQENQELKNIINQIGFEPDEIAFLQQENQELKLELSGYRQAILEDKDMLGLKEENTELKKQLEENKDKINWYENFEINKTIDKLRIKHNNQQKEFIEWLENGIEKVRNTEFLDERIQRAGLIAYNRCLRKYKKIIGVSDEKEN